MKSFGFIYCLSFALVGAHFKGTTNSSCHKQLIVCSFAAESQSQLVTEIVTTTAKASRAFFTPEQRFSGAHTDKSVWIFSAVAVNTCASQQNILCLEIPSDSWKCKGRGDEAPLL